MGTIQANIFLYNKLAGTLEKSSNGYRFSYLENYDGPPLSLSLSKEKKVHYATALFPYFKSLLPEGWLLKQYSQAQQIDEKDELNLIHSTPFIQDPVGIDLLSKSRQLKISFLKLEGSIFAGS